MVNCESGIYIFFIERMLWCVVGVWWCGIYKNPTSSAFNERFHGRIVKLLRIYNIDFNHQMFL